MLSERTDMPTEHAVCLYSASTPTRLLPLTTSPLSYIVTILNPNPYTWSCNVLSICLFLYLIAVINYPSLNTSSIKEY